MYQIKYPKEPLAENIWKCLEKDNTLLYRLKMGRVMRKPDFCICENKDADQLRGNREADQHLCFRYLDSTIPLLLKSEISSLWSSSVVVQPGLCRTWSETPKTGFLTTRLKCSLCCLAGLPKSHDCSAEQEDKLFLVQEMVKR